MIDITIQVAGLDEALKLLFDTAAGSEAVMKRTNYRIAALIRDTARDYAPRSPTVQDIRQATGRAMLIRKDRGHSRPTPGGLERAIDFEADAADATVFVSSNSEAGAYAFMIHEQKGLVWHHRGVGTISKGSKADDQFITRAIADKADQAFAIIQDAQAKVWKSGGV